MNIIFDLDGTIIDSVPGITASLVYAICQQGHVIDENINISSLIGPPMDKIVSTLLKPYGDERIAETVNIYREHYGLVGLDNSVMYEGIFSSLDELRGNGHKLFIATSKRHAFAEKIMDNINIRKLFSDIIGTPEDGSMDDKKRLLSHIISKNSLEINATVMIGDRKEDIFSARHNNIISIGALWGYGSLKELSESCADYLCEVPSGLCDLIRKVEKNSAF